MLKKVEFPILILLFSFAIYCALIIGNSWDELGHIYIGNERLKYLFSFGSYDYFDFRENRFYPGFYDTLSTFVTKTEFNNKLCYFILTVENETLC